MADQSRPKEENYYAKMKELEAELEILQIQEDYLRDE